MGFLIRMTNVGKGERIFRLIIGVLSILLVFFISGIFRWIIGLIGVGFILTAIFGY